MTWLVMVRLDCRVGVSKDAMVFVDATGCRAGGLLLSWLLLSLTGACPGSICIVPGFCNLRSYGWGPDNYNTDYVLLPLRDRHGIKSTAHKKQMVIIV